MVSKLELVKAVMKEVVRVWMMAGYKIIGDKPLKAKIEKLVDEYQALLKDSKKTHPAAELKREKWVEKIEKLFDCAAPDVMEVLRKNRLLEEEDKKEDEAFLLDQRTVRLQYIGQKDESFAKKVASREAEKQAEAKRKDLEEKRKEVEAIQKLEQRKEGMKRELETGKENDSEDDPDFTEASTGKRRKRPEVLKVDLPKAPFSDPFVCATLDRLKITSNAAVSLVSAVPKTGQVDGETTDLNSFVMSRLSLETSRNISREEAARVSRVHFRETNPKHGELHWDGKLLTDSLGKSFESQAILITGPTHWEEGKLLDVAMLVDEDGERSATGEIRFEALKKAVVDWDVKDIIRSTCIDTEAVNTGCVRGACIRLKKWLGRPVLDLGCRHHMSELMSKATYYIVFDEDLCPDNKMMVMFKGMWDQLDTSPDALVFKLDQEDIPGKEEALDFYRMILTTLNRNSVLPRDDYRYIAFCLTAQNSSISNKTTTLHYVSLHSTTFQHISPNVSTFHHILALVLIVAQ